ncbi:Protein slowmo [Lamellibrachia satsuma]|nr:Protein slowmo [Lamellibrachia satsuma]
MKLWTSEHTFHHPWDTVVQAAWRKYPNPLNPSVVALDVIERNLDNRSGALKVRRLMTTEWGIPNWIVKLIGMTETCYVDERIEVDPHKKQMTLLSRNLTYCKFLTMSETLVYSQDPKDPSRTLLVQDTSVNVHGIPMTSYIEGLVEGSCTNNSHKGRQAMEWVISKIKAEAQDLSRVANTEMDNLKNLSNPSKSSC